MRLTEPRIEDTNMQDSISDKVNSIARHDEKERVKNHAVSRSVEMQHSNSVPQLYESSMTKTPQGLMHVCHLCNTNFSDIAMFNLHMKAHSVESEKERVKRKRPVYYFTVPQSTSGHPPTKLIKLGNHRDGNVTFAISSGNPSSYSRESQLIQPVFSTKERLSRENTVNIRKESIVRAPPPALLRSTNSSDVDVNKEGTSDYNTDNGTGTPLVTVVSRKTSFHSSSSDDHVLVSRDPVPLYTSRSPTSPMSSRKELSCIYDAGYPITSADRLSEPSKTNAQTNDRVIQVAECGLCSLTFSAHILLDRHVQEAHLNEAGRFNCNYCPKDFASMTSLKRHMKAYHDGDYLPCRTGVIDKVVSPGSSISSEESTRNRLEASVFQGFSCSFCGRYFDTPSQLQVHVSAEHPGLTKGEQPRSHATAKRIRQHPVTYECPNCKAEFTQFDVFLEHLEKHVEEKEKSEDRRRMARYKELFCTECKIDYETMESFLKHLESCPGPRSMLTNKQNGHKSFLIDQHTAGKSIETENDKKHDDGPVTMATVGYGAREEGEINQATHAEPVNFYPDVVEVSTSGGNKSQHQLCYSCQTCNTRFAKLDDYLDHLQTHDVCMKAAGHQTRKLEQQKSEEHLIDSHEKNKNITCEILPGENSRKLYAERDGNVVVVTVDKNTIPPPSLSENPSQRTEKPPSNDLVYHCQSCRMCFAKLDMYLEHLELHCEWEDKPGDEKKEGSTHAVLNRDGEKKEGHISSQPNERKESQEETKIVIVSERSPILQSPLSKQHSPSNTKVVESITTSNLPSLVTGYPYQKKDDSGEKQNANDKNHFTYLTSDKGRLKRDNPQLESVASTIVHHHPPFNSLAKNRPPHNSGSRPTPHEPGSRRYSCQICSLELRQFDEYLAHVASHKINQRRKDRSPRLHEQNTRDVVDTNIAEREQNEEAKFVYCVIPVKLGARVKETLDGNGPFFMCHFCDIFYKNLEQLQAHMDGHYASEKTVTIASLTPTSKTGLSSPSMRIPSPLRSPNKAWCSDERVESSRITNTRLQQHISVTSETNKTTSLSVTARKDVTDSINGMVEVAHSNPNNASFAEHEVGPPASSGSGTVVEGSAAYVCKTCKTGFSSLDDIMRHIADTGHDSRIEPARNVESGRISCPVCGVKVRSQEKFMTHLRHQHLFKKSHVCPTCNLGFSGRYDLLLHMEQQHATNPQCVRREHPTADFNHGPSIKGLPGAGKNDHAADNYEDVDNDNTTHDSVFICQPCRRQFSEENEFLKHIQTHEPVRSLEMTEPGVQVVELQAKSHNSHTRDSGESAPMIAEYWSLASAGDNNVKEKQA